MSGWISVTAPNVKGARDAEFKLVGRHAYVVSTVNDVRPGHRAADFEYRTFKEHDGVIRLTIPGRDQRTIMFGKLEKL